MKINQDELLKLATPKKKVVIKKLTKEAMIVSYLKKYGKTSAWELFKAVRLSGHAKEITENMAFKNLIKIIPCKCGEGRFFDLP